jgi:hypothetical protein
MRRTAAAARVAVSRRRAAQFLDLPSVQGAFLASVVSETTAKINSSQGMVNWFPHGAPRWTSNLPGTPITFLSPASGNRPTFASNGINGRPAWQFFPAGSSTALTVNGAAASWLTTTDYTAIVLVQCKTLTDDATQINNSAVFADLAASTNYGLFFRGGATPTVYAVNRDSGGLDVVSDTFGGENLPVIATVRHTGGNLKLKVDERAEVSVASGNTSSISSAMAIGRGSNATATAWKGLIGALVFAKVAWSDDECLRARNRIRRAWGLAVVGA